MSTVLFLRYGFIDIVGAVIAVSIGTGVLKLCVMGDLWLHQGTLWTVYPMGLSEDWLLVPYFMCIMLGFLVC